MECLFVRIRFDRYGYLLVVVLRVCIYSDVQIKWALSKCSHEYIKMYQHILVFTHYLYILFNTHRSTITNINRYETSYFTFSTIVNMEGNDGPIQMFRCQIPYEQTTHRKHIKTLIKHTNTHINHTSTYVKAYKHAYEI